MRGENRLLCAGVVVTYNRKEELLKNLNSIKTQTKQFDRYYIIDNCSKDGTYEALKKSGVVSNPYYKYIRLEKNIGGAGGFYTGLKQAYDDGFDLVCLMDDDGRPADNDCIKILYETAEEVSCYSKKMILNSLVICDKTTGRLSFGLGTLMMKDEVCNHSVNGLLLNNINPFNGTVISKELIKEIGLPNKDFFIRGDEVDYSIRAKKAGAFIATVTNSLYYHPGMNLTIIKWNGKTIGVESLPPWKAYYTIRNEVYRRKRDEGIPGSLKSLAFRLYSNKKCNSEPKACRLFIWKGFFDGLTGHLGRTVEPGQYRF